MGVNDDRLPAWAAVGAVGAVLLIVVLMCIGAALVGPS